MSSSSALEILIDDTKVNLVDLTKFMSVNQYNSLVRTLLRGEEIVFFKQKTIEMVNIIETMPVTYEQDGLGDNAIVYLHYFYGGSDWYITEKDIEGGILQAYGFAILNGDLHNAEMGYISIAELVNIGVEMDFYFEKKNLGEIKKELGIL